MSATVMELPLVAAPAPAPPRIKPIKVFPEQLYLEPTSACNLECTMCYTNVINGANRRTLSYEQVIGFVRRYAAAVPGVLDVYWCGTGEAFLHKDFPRMVNGLLECGDAMEQTIQTNGTIHRLDEFTSLARLAFNVSVDGPKDLHEWHRGPNTFDRTMRFCRDALDRGCKALTIRCLVRRDNIERLDEYHEALTDWLGPRFTIELGTPFNNSMLRPLRDTAHAINQKDIDDSRTISTADALRICAEKYHGRFAISVSETVDNYISLNTYGVFTCCHGVLKIGDIDDPIPTLIQRMIDSEPDCMGCSMHPCQ